MEFESRKRVEEDIMEFLRDDRTCMIAICGAGGVGKTTMVHRIEERVRKENLFHEVVCVVVSQQIDLLKNQKEIAELLGLKFSEDTLAARAHKLRTRLQDSKTKLIIFDDVWKSFKLEDIGIPFENGFTKCKIILTSRITDACNKMGAKIIQMELLKKEEAWALFKEKAGSYVEGPDLLPIAENVVDECKGLPVALVAVGVALKDKSIPVWRDSLSQLSRSIPTDFSDVREDVYKPLKLSYDFLEDNLKNLFLMCCLFPEDYDIPIELLTLYGIGLHMFERIRNIEEGRNRTCSLVEKLKSCFLLLNGSKQHTVKMHDVVRDVAIFIGSKEKDGFLMNKLEAFSMDSSSKDSSRNCNWMSIDISTENAKLLVGSNFLYLRFMMIQDPTYDYSKRGSGGVPNIVVDGNNVICFEGMQGLKVLSISYVYFRSLPSTMELLKELRTLRLENCFVKDISVLGELACLEILCIHGCRDIEELPTDIGRLNFLRLLELYHCTSLKRVVAGVISSLVRLEELTISGCFDKWEAKGNRSEERNAGLSELESLPNLTSLVIQISDCNLLAEEICLSKKLVRYRILFGPYNLSSWGEYDRGISIHLPGDITVGNWIRLLARSTQLLALEGELSTQFPVKLAELEEIIYGTIPEVSNFIQKLESIRLTNLPELAHLWKSQNQNVSLGNLKHISIIGCPNLCSLFGNAKVEIPGLNYLDLISLPITISKIWCRHVPINFFHNLKRLYIKYVNGVSNLISTSIAKNLVNLNYLHIEGCHEIVDLIEDEEEVFATTLFRNLGRLYILRSHKVRSFCQWKHALELPSLRYVTIEDCPVMETFTLGSLSTPSLFKFEIDGKEIETKDLNGGIRDRLRIKTGEQRGA